MTPTKIILVFSVIFFSCKKIRICNDCEKAILYYAPNCATIKGYVILKDSTIKVFNHNIPNEFRKQGLDVCISYKSKGDNILTTDCAMGELIKITCFQ